MAYLRPEVYSESCLYRNVQAYSDIFDSDGSNDMFFDYNDVNFNARLSLLK